jgi:hypothetical protein
VQSDRSRVVSIAWQLTVTSPRLAQAGLHAAQRFALARSRGALVAGVQPRKLVLDLGMQILRKLAQGLEVLAKPRHIHRVASPNNPNVLPLDLEHLDEPVNHVNHTTIDLELLDVPVHHSSRQLGRGLGLGFNLGFQLGFNLGFNLGFQLDALCSAFGIVTRLVDAIGKRLALHFLRTKGNEK